MQRQTTSVKLFRNRFVSAVQLVALSVACVLVLVLGTAAPASAETKAIAEGQAGFKQRVAPFFNTYCVSCHGPEKNKGKITVHALHGDLSLGQELDKWESILDMLEFGEMPPDDSPQPKPGEVEAVSQWIESGMRAYVDKVSQEATEPKTRRLTNVEYENTLSELLGFELDVIDRLPEDPEHHYHFNNTADLMRMGPEQLNRYKEIARHAMRSAIVDPGDKPEVYKKSRQWTSGGNHNGMAPDEVGVWGNRRGTAAGGLSMIDFPTHGEFKLTIKASAIVPKGFAATPVHIDMGATPGRTETPFKTVAKLYLTNTPDEPKTIEIRGRIENIPSAPAQQGRRGKLADQIAILPRVVYDNGRLNDFYPGSENLAFPRAVIHSMEIEIPVIDQWPPAHHTAILFDSPLRASDPPAYIRAVLERFMTRAYRRPVTGAEVEKFVKIFRLIEPSTQTFEAAMRETLAMVLISPQFLYHTESDPATDAHYAMASRLSYFLWAGMPDQELFQLAAQRQLDDPQVIEKQVLRMLADERSNAFVENFTMQWMSIDKSLTVPINRELFPRFTYIIERGETAGTEVPYHPSTRDYMIQETVGFVGEMIRRNANVLSVVDSDFAYLNERLAIHYGLEGVKGMQFRAVPIKPEDNLGGLMTHGSVLIGNGTGTAPHPIYRAVWLREAILGDKVAPPPSEIPSLTDTAGESLEEATSIAELLALHRTVESCNDCHFRLDPWGIPFEEYNAIGQYQPKVVKMGTRVQGFNPNKHENLEGYQAYLDSIFTEDVDAAAQVPHGPKIDGLRELKDFLLNNRDEDIAENVIRRLLTYSIGRTLTYRDRFAVEHLFEQAEDNDFKMRDIIVSICLSDTFRDAKPDQTSQKED